MPNASVCKPLAKAIREESKVKREEKINIY